MKIDDISQLDITTYVNDDYKEYKESIKNGTFFEEYNLTNGELERIESEKCGKYIDELLEAMFDENNIITFSSELDNIVYVHIIVLFKKIYELYLNRQMVKCEKGIFDTAIKIMLWKIKGKTFSNIVSFRYAYATKSTKRKEILKEMGKDFDFSWMNANYLVQFGNIPNKKVYSCNLNENKSVLDVDYDRIMVDTYDYLDKLLGFRLGDMLYAAFYKFFEKTGDERALKLSKYIKYGTIDEKGIWLLRYGFEFEDFSWLYSKVESINEYGIKLANEINFNDVQKNKIYKFTI